MGRQNGGQVEQALHGRLGEAGPRGQVEAPGIMVKIMVIIMKMVVTRYMHRIYYRNRVADSSTDFQNILEMTENSRYIDEEREAGMKMTTMLV